MSVQVVLLFAIGASLGSFCNVCIFRLPRDIDVITTRSFCPHCKARLRWFELIPIVSYVLQKGKCNRCHERISLQYPIVEFTSGLVVMVLFSKYGISAEAFKAAMFLLTMLVVTIIDWRHLVIPNSLLLVSFAAALTVTLTYGTVLFAESVLGAFVSISVTLLVMYAGNFVFRKKTMGFGDVKLAGVIGIYIGWRLFLACFWISAVIGALYGIVLILLFKRERDTKLPFGTFLAATSSVMFLLKQEFENGITKWPVQIF